MKFAKIGALAAAAVVVVAACSGTTAEVQRHRPRGSARRQAASRKSARTRRARARTRSTSTPACRARVRTRSRRTRSSSRSRTRSTARRSATSRSSTSTSTTRRPPTTATGTARSSRRTPTRRPLTRMPWSTSAPTTRARRSWPIPILNQACLVMVSPANSYPGLTKAVEGVDPARVSRTPTTRPATATTPASSPPMTSRVPRAPNGPSRWQEEGLRPGRHPGLRRRPCQGVGPPCQRDRHRGPQPEQDVRGLRRQGDRLRRPGPEDQGRPVRTSSTSARSPARTPASSGRTFARRCPTSTIMTGDGVFEKSWYDRLPALPATARSSPSAAWSGSADRRWQDLVRQVQGRSRRQLSRPPTRPTATPPRRSPWRPPDGCDQRPLRGPQGRHGHEGPADRPRHDDVRPERRRRRWLDQRVQGRDELAAGLRLILRSRSNPPDHQLDLSRAGRLARPACVSGLADSSSTRRH